MGGALAIAGPAIGIGSSILGMANTGGGGTGTYGGNPNVYIPGGQSNADQLYQSIFSQMAPYAQTLPQQVLPALQAYTGNLQNNVAAPFLQYTANQAGAAGQTQGLADLQAAQSMSQLAGQGAPYAGQLLSTGFDPQQALYNRVQQQVGDQAAAQNAMYGLSSSPYGAGVANQALSNFNIDWQNQELQRQLQAAQGYGNLVSSVGRGYAGGAELGAGGVQQLTQAGQIPYSAYAGIQQQGIGALNQLTGGTTAAFGPSQNLANLLQSYLGLGQSASGLAQQGQQQQFLQNQAYGQNLASALTNPALSQLFGGSSSSSPYGNFQGTIGGFDPLYSYGGSATSYDPLALAGAF